LKISPPFRHTARIQAIRACLLLLCVVLALATHHASTLHAQTRSYIIPDVAAPGMGTYIEIIGQYDFDGRFGTDGIYPNNQGDAVRVVLERPEDSTKVIIGPVSVSWNGRMVATHIFVLPNVLPNSSYWNELRDEFRIPVNVIVRESGRNRVVNTDTVYIVQPFLRIEDCSSNVGQDSVVIGVVGANRRVARSKRGAILLESVSLDGTKKYGVATDDTDSVRLGNQGFLPFVMIVRGAFDGNGTSINVSAVGKTAGPGGGGGGGQVCDANPTTVLDNQTNQSGGNGFTGGGGGGVNKAGIFTQSFWARGGTGADITFPTALLGNRAAQRMDGGFGLNAVPGGTSGNNETDHPQSAGGGTGHPFGRSGPGWNGTNESIPTAGGGMGRGENTAGDAGGFGRGGFSAFLGSGTDGGGAHGNIAVVPIAGGSGGASGNPRSLIPGGCSGSGGGGGGAIRVAAQSVRNVSLIARGGVGARGTTVSVPILGSYTAPSGGDGSGGHVGIMSKLPVSDIRADVRSGTEENSGAGRMRFDTPNAFGSGQVLPQSNADYRFISSVVLDTLSEIKSPYSQRIRIRGFVGERVSNTGITVNNIRFFYRTTTGSWQQVDTIPEPFVAGRSDIPFTFSQVIPPRPQGNEQDSLVFVLAAELFNSANNRDNPPYVINPQWILSQAASNILRVPALPLISVQTGNSTNNANNATFPMITRCEGETRTTTITVTVRNGRGGLLNVRGIRFTGEFAQALSASPSTFTVAQNAEQRVTVTLNANATLRPDIEFFTATQMLIDHNDSLPDVGGAARPNPWRIDFSAQVRTIRYDIRTFANNLQNAVLDFGRVGIGGTAFDTVRISNISSARSPLRFTVSAERQPLSSAPFQFQEQSTESGIGGVALPVSFSPTLIGAATAQTLRVRVENTAGNCPFSTIITIALRGTGVQPELDTTGSTRTAPLGIVSVCAPLSTTTTLPILLANSGNDTLLIRNIRLNTTNASLSTSFTLSTTSLAIATGATASLLLTFTSPVTTQATTTFDNLALLIETNDARFGAASPYRIPITLTLRSFYPSLRLIPPDAFAFGGVRFFTRQQRTVTLANNGNMPLTVELSSIRAPFRLLAPIQARLVLQPNQTQAITVEVAPTDAQREGDALRELLLFMITPSEGVCTFRLPPLEITATPQGPAALPATLWLDTLNSVNMRRDTIIRLWGRVQTLLQNRNDNLRAGFLIRRSMFFPKGIASPFGQATIELSQVRDRDRAVIVNVPSVSLGVMPTLIAEIRGTPILTDTMRAALEWLPMETRWARRDSVYFNDSLANGFMATFVPILASPQPAPRLTSGPVAGQMPRLALIGNIKPNPAHDLVQMTLYTEEAGEYILHVVNTLGNRILTRSWSKQQDGAAAQELIELDVRNLPSGAYFLRVISPQGRVESHCIGVQR
jgi:hypothetical protein